MRVGVTRAVLRSEVQIEAGLSTAAGHDTQHAARINHLLNRIEREEAVNFSWPTRTIKEEVTVAADSATGDLPTDITFTMISSVWTLYGTEWLPVGYGIGARERSIFGADARATPIQRWEIVAPGDTEYEVWPISAQDETLRFTGEITPGLMDDDADVCVLDADVLVLLAAGELLAKGDKELAEVKFAKAAQRRNGLLNRQIGRKESNVNLAERPGRLLRPGLDFIPPTTG